MANKDLFLNAVGFRIFDLCDPGRPAGPGTERDAYDWFATNACPQPLAVNTWMSGKLVQVFYGALGAPAFGSWPNAVSYVAALSARVNGLILGAVPAGGDALAAYIWLNGLPVVDGTQGEIPVEVLNWAKVNLPSLICALPLNEPKSIGARMAIVND